MRKMLVGVFALLSCAISASDAHACDCIRTPSPQKAFDFAEAVFTGKVTSIKPYGYKPGQVEVEFTVSEVYKGIKIKRTILNQPGSNCDFQFQVGGEYLVYATPSPYESKDILAPLTTNICGRTRLKTRAEDDLDFLKSLNDK